MRRLLAIATISLASAGCLDFDQFGNGSGDGGPAPLDGTVTLADFAGSVADLGRPADDLRVTLPHDLWISSQSDLATNDLAPCKPGILACMGSEILWCNDQQNAVILDCHGPCRGPDNCGLCQPNSDYCDDKTASFGTCTDVGGYDVGTPCAVPVNGDVNSPGQCASSVACAQCINAVNGSVCGDGNAQSVVGTLYSCNGGMLGNPVACAYGCDPSVGRCRDLVPANQAAQHLAQADTFTCVNGNSKLSDLTTDGNHNVSIDTTNGIITVDGKATNLNVLWGAPYLPTNGNTMVRVLHVRSLGIGQGNSVSISGNNSLIVLADQNASINGAVNAATKINLAGYNSVTGPGANSKAAGGAGGNGGANNIGDNGGGGAGHGTKGANGGGFANLATSAGGAPYGSGVMLEAGTNGGGDGNTAGGAGGGALQITACGTITISQYVLLNASGGGGAAGFEAAQAANGGGGGGGGSGGTFIFEATKVSIDGEVVSNGGGGGAGGVGNLGMIVASPGANWDPASSPSSPAPGGLLGGGAGGAGGAGKTLPVDGATSKMQFIGSGGGGGAIGRIFVNTAPGIIAAPLTNSSPASTNSVVCVTDKGQAPTPCIYP